MLLLFWRLVGKLGFKLSLGPTACPCDVGEKAYPASALTHGHLFWWVDVISEIGQRPLRPVSLSASQPAMLLAAFPFWLFQIWFILRVWPQKQLISMQLSPDFTFTYAATLLLKIWNYTACILTCLQLNCQFLKVSLMFQIPPKISILCSIMFSDHVERTFLSMKPSN